MYQVEGNHKQVSDCNAGMNSSCSNLWFHIVNWAAVTMALDNNVHILFPE